MPLHQQGLQEQKQWRLYCWRFPVLLKASGCFYEHRDHWDLLRWPPVWKMQDCVWVGAYPHPREISHSTDSAQTSPMEPAVPTMLPSCWAAACFLHLQTVILCTHLSQSSSWLNQSGSQQETNSTCTLKIIENSLREAGYRETTNDDGTPEQIRGTLSLPLDWKGKKREWFSGPGNRRRGMLDKSTAAFSRGRQPA